MSTIYEKWQHCYPAVFRNIHVSLSSSECGMGLFTKCKMEKGEIIYTDEPLIAMQHLYSRRTYLACYQCFRTIGGLCNLIDLILKNVDKSLAASYPEILDILTAKNEAHLIGPLPLANTIPCPNNCGAMFCSQTCLQLANEQHHHRILCIEMTATQRLKWKRFVRHAQLYHENFILAGFTFGEIICMTRYLGYSLQSAMEEFSSFYQKPWHTLEHRTHVSDTFLCSKTHRLTIMQASFTLLEACLLDYLELNNVLNHPWKPLFCLDFYATLLGEFDLVNVNLEFDNPLNAQLCSAFQTPFGRQLLENCLSVFSELKNIIHCRSSLADQEPLPFLSTSLLASFFPPFMGIALFRSVALTNHSCWPNAEVDFREGKETQVRATRFISQEEEVFQSYIDEHLVLHERQRLLQSDFGFRCTCPRCRIEAMEELLKRKKTLPVDESECEKLISMHTKVGIPEIQAIKRFVASLHTENNYETCACDGGKNL